MEAIEATIDRHSGVRLWFGVGLGTKDFTRIGIGRPPENIPAESFVLSPFSDAELVSLREIFLEIKKNAL